MTPQLTVSGVTKRFTVGGTPVVNGVSFTVYPGEIFALVGPSGCGKTTTLRLIAGFENADAGTIIMADTMADTMTERVFANDETHVPPEARGIGFVFQDFALFPHKNVLDNVAFGLRKVPKKTRRDRAMVVLEMVGLTALHARLPHHLSGGEQQRVALARSIIARPQLLLLDEPFSNLDPGLRQTTREEVRALLKAEGISVVLVTHSQEEALSFAERLAVMKEGTVVQIGTPEEVYRQPKTAYVADFLGQTNFIRADVKDGVAETPFGDIPVGALCKGTTSSVLLSIRPESLTMEAEREGQGFRIIGRAFKGYAFLYQVEGAGKPYFVQTDADCPFQVGDSVVLKAVSAVPVAAD